MNNNLSRELYDRTKSEKILDKYLLKNKPELQKIEKQLYGEQNKKVKIESDKPQLTCQQALEQVLKYLNNENKVSIALQKIKKLIADYKIKFYPLHLYQVLYQLSNQKYQLKEHECDQTIQEIFELSTLEKFSNIRNIFQIQLMLRIKLKTDDTYMFHDALKQLKQEINHLNIDSIIILENDIDDLNKKEPIEQYEYEILQDFQSFMRNSVQQFRQKQIYLMNCLEELIQQFKFQWAKSSIHSFIQNLNFTQKQQFNEEFQEQINQIIERIQNGKLLSQASNDRENAKNAKLMQDYLKPIHEIVDSRATVNTGDGLDQWQLKQSGL